MIRNASHKNVMVPPSGQRSSVPLGIGLLVLSLVSCSKDPMPKGFTEFHLGMPLAEFATLASASPNLGMIRVQREFGEMAMPLLGDPASIVSSIGEWRHNVAEAKDAAIAHSPNPGMTALAWAESGYIIYAAPGLTSRDDLGFANIKFTMTDEGILKAVTFTTKDSTPSAYDDLVHQGNSKYGTRSDQQSESDNWRTEWTICKGTVPFKAAAVRTISDSRGAVVFLALERTDRDACTGAKRPTL